MSRGCSRVGVDVLMEKDGVMERSVRNAGISMKLLPAFESKSSDAAFQLGEGRLRVPMKLHALNRQRLCHAFCAVISDSEGDLIVLKGGVSNFRDATDHEDIFRQESFFQWTFGVKEPECFGILEPKACRSTLFVPRLPSEYAIWLGHIPSKDEWQKHYAVDAVHYVDEIPQFINGRTSIFYPQGINTDSGNVHKGPIIDGVTSSRTEEDFLRTFELMSELRMVKTDMEIEVIRYAAKVSSEAHIVVMQSIRPGMYEFQLEALFLHHAYSVGGCRNSSYTCICGTGPSGAALHYGHAGAPNDRLIKDGDICLLDMGAEYHCYGSDITCSYPANGKFTVKQRQIYEAVLDAQKAVFAELRPGVAWTDMHILAEKVILNALREAGYLRGNVEEMLESRLGAVFMPHGLGHTLGIDTHDVGGILTGHPKKSSEPGLRSLRMTRKLQENMVLTVEPGLYFNRALLQSAFSDPVLSRFLCREQIEPMMNFGGVRLEDDILITADGYENFTLVPREVEDVEQVMSGAKWVPRI